MADDFQGPVSAHEFGLALGQFLDARTGGDFSGFSSYFALMAHLYFREVEGAPGSQPPD